MCLGHLGVGRGIERVERNLLTLMLRWVGCGLVGWYLCNPISKQPVGAIFRIAGGNIQNCAHQFECLAFASSSGANGHTGPVVQVVRAEEIK